MQFLPETFCVLGNCVSFLFEESRDKYYAIIPFFLLQKRKHFMLFTADYISNMCGNAPFVFSYLTTRFRHSIGKSGVQELWEIADTLKRSKCLPYSKWVAYNSISAYVFRYLLVHFGIMKY